MKNIAIEEKTIKRYSLYCGTNLYYIDVEISKDNYSEFNIKRENYGVSDFVIGLDMSQLEETELEFISRNFLEWVNIYEEMVEYLESQPIE